MVRFSFWSFNSFCHSQNFFLKLTNSNSILQIILKLIKKFLQVTRYGGRSIYSPCQRKFMDSAVLCPGSFTYNLVCMQAFEFFRDSALIFPVTS